VVNDSVMGSILFAVQHLGCRLVLVLGHSRCSVVASAVQTWARNKSLTREGQSVRTLAEGVQQTLSHGPTAGHLQLEAGEVSFRWGGGRVNVDKFLAPSLATCSQRPVK